MRKDKALFLLLVLSFVGLIVDIRYEHRDVLQETWQAWIPLVTALVGIIATLMAMTRKPKLQAVAAAVYILVALVGLLGIWEHTKFRAYMFTRYITLADKDASGRPFRGGERPTFPPLTFTLFGSIGFVLTTRSMSWSAEDGPGGIG